MNFRIKIRAISETKYGPYDGSTLAAAIERALFEHGKDGMGAVTLIAIEEVE